MDTESSHSPSEAQSESVNTPVLHSVRALPPGYIVLWFVTILSLVFNVLILNQLTIVRQAARQAITDAIAVADNLQNTTLSYTAVIDDTIPINADLGLNESIPVPINETLPIDATVNVPVKVGPFGSYSVTIPISGTVPVNTTLNLTLNQPLHVSTTVPVHLEVPIQVVVKDTPLATTLNDMKTRLEALALQLDRPLLSFGQDTPKIAPIGTPESSP